MKKEIINIKNMTCVSCEQILKTEISKVKGVKDVKVRASTGEVVVSGDDFSFDEILEKIKEAGYEVGTKNTPFFTKEKLVWQHFALSVILILILISLLKLFNINIIPPSLTSKSSLFVPLAIGVVAGFSTCMAVVGGLVLGVSAKFSESQPNLSGIKKFTPHIFFNIGRIFSFFIFGGLLGLMGSFVKFNSTAIGAISIIVALVMLILGLQITEAFPKIRFGFGLPSFRKNSSSEYTNVEAMIFGGLTFFLPCGFTQAMQIFAISTGNFWSGALALSLFAIGTSPALLGIGGLVSFMKENERTKFFFRFVGVILIFFAFYNLNNGVNLVGVKKFLPEFVISYSNQADKTDVTSGDKDVNATVVDGVQVLKATYDSKNIIAPKHFIVDSGKLVRLEILAKEDGVGCMSSVLIPGLYSQPQYFKKGQTVVMEFTPGKPGNYKITCAMGVTAATLEVR